MRCSRTRSSSKHSPLPLPSRAKEELAGLEDEILGKLVGAPADLLGDEALIKSIEGSKAAVTKIEAAVEKATHTEVPRKDGGVGLGGGVRIRGYFRRHLILKQNSSRAAIDTVGVVDLHARVKASCTACSPTHPLIQPSFDPPRRG